jgi:hypothetical protein
LHVNAGVSFADVWLGDANSTNGAELGRLAFVGYGGVLAPPETIYAAITGRIVDHANFKGALSFYTSSTEQMRISSSGKVGIGTTDPQTDLHVHGSVGAIRMTNPTTGIANGLQLGFITDNSVDAAIWNSAGGGYLKFGTASYERMRITSDGKVGIRTDAPTGILHVAGGTAYSGQDGLGITLKAEDGYSVGGLYGDGTDGGDIILMPGLGGYGGWFSGSDGELGGVGIGTTGPTEKLVVNGSINSNNQSNNFGSGGTRVLMDLISASKIARIGTVAGGDSLSGTQGELGLYVKSSEYVRINAAGNVGIGCTDPSEKLDVAGTARLRGIAAGSGTTVVADGNGKLWKASSSQRYKTNIKALDADTDAVLKLRPVRFQWRTTGQNDIGLIAEEVEQQLNELVIYDNEGRPDAVKYDRVSLYLLDVVKDLKAENESLKQRLTSLETMVQHLTKGKEFEP